MKRIKIQKSQEEITLEKVNDAMKRVYFCPSCKNIFRSEQDYKHLGNNKFSCQECLIKSFTRDTYKGHINDKKPFSMNGNNDEATIYNHIAKIVINFKKDGLSNNNIYIITQFPIAMISRIVQKSLPQDISMSLEDFLLSELKLEQLVSDMILNKGKLKTADEENVIIQAIKYGCSRDFIVDLLHIKKDKITRQNKIIKLSNDDKLKDAIKYNKDRRTLKLSSRKVFFTYGKKK